MDTALRLSGVAKFYGSKLVFKGLDLELERGEVLLVVGPNGSGKSTLLKVMCGLCRPSAGTVQQGYGPDKTGYLAHETFIYPGLSALENLRFWAGLYGWSADEAGLLAVLERMGLKRAAFERAGSFSRGMAQRLSLARVFMREPMLLFLDEPGTGLDLQSREIMLREVGSARHRGASLVWVSHDAASDAERADRVLAFTGEGRAEVESAGSWLEARRAEAAC